VRRENPLCDEEEGRAERNDLGMILPEVVRMLRGSSAWSRQPAACRRKGEVDARPARSVDVGLGQKEEDERLERSGGGARKRRPEVPADAATRPEVSHIAWELQEKKLPLGVPITGGEPAVSKVGVVSDRGLEVDRHALSQIGDNAEGRGEAVRGRIEAQPDTRGRPPDEESKNRCRRHGSNHQE
jgi:hypothetical protein